MAHSIWILFVFVAAAGQVARNAMQSSLTGQLGVIGAAHVRFLYGLPFGIVFLSLIAAAQGLPPPPNLEFTGWILMGSFAQIGGMALVLSLMQSRSFVVATAYVKMEPVLVAVFGLAALGDRLSLGAMAAVIVATGGVLLLSWPTSRRNDLHQGGFKGRAALAGLASAALFGLAAIGFRGAILALGDTPYGLRASTALATSLLAQTVILTIYLTLVDPDRLRAVLKAWRFSLPAGFFGAAASLFWFMAFALETAAHVRTLALVEILLAGVVTKRFFHQAMSGLEILGILIMVMGIAGMLIT